MKLCIMKLKVRLECILKVFFADDKMVVQSYPSRMGKKNCKQYYYFVLPHSMPLFPQNMLMKMIICFFRSEISFVG